MKKMLVVYYSWSNGNTKKIAEQLANKTGADIARIETAEPYRGSHEEYWKKANHQQMRNFLTKNRLYFHILPRKS